MNNINEFLSDLQFLIIINVDVLINHIKEIILKTTVHY